MPPTSGYKAPMSSLLVNDGASVLDMMDQFRGDATLSNLFTQLDELSTRVSVAQRLNVNKHQGSKTVGDGGGDDSADAAAGSGHGGGRAAGLPLEAQRSVDHDNRVGSLTHNMRVEDVILPMPPSERGAALPAPDGLGMQEWEALQAAVNDACSHFKTAASSSAWKRWCLTQANAGLLVSLLWWVVASVFHPSSVFAEPVKEAAFQHFSRLYLSEVLGFHRLNKDLYQKVWIECLTAATITLLQWAWPRSAHKFDVDIASFLSRQLRLWTAGTLLSDLHPSAHAPPGDHASAAEFSSSLYNSDNPAASTLIAASGSFNALNAPQSPPAGRARSAPLSESPSSHLPAPSMSRQQGLSRQVPPPSSPQQLGHSESASVHHVFRSTKTSPVISRMMRAHTLQPSSYSGSGLHKESVGVVHRSRHRALDMPAEEELSYKQMARSLHENTATALKQYDKLKVQATLGIAERRRLWLAERDGVDEMLSKLQQARKVKTLSDRLSGWVGDVPNSTHWITSPADERNSDAPSKVELLTVLAEGGSASAQRLSNQMGAQRSSAAVGGGGGGDVGPHGLPRHLANANSASQKAMRMKGTPVYDMQKLEDRVTTALSAKPRNSEDLAARLGALAKNGAAADSAAAKQLQGFPRGRRDIKVARIVRGIIHGMDLEQYAH